MDVVEVFFEGWMDLLLLVEFLPDENFAILLVLNEESLVHGLKVVSKILRESTSQFHFGMNFGIGCLEKHS